jgi:hypothetical protein
LKPVKKVKIVGSELTIFSFLDSTGKRKRWSDAKKRQNLEPFDRLFLPAGWISSTQPIK